MLFSLLTLAASALAIDNDKKYWQIVDDSQNLLRYGSGAGPYVQATGFGIDYNDLPENVTVDMAWMLSRHGERYPAVSVGHAMRNTYNKLKAANASYTGPLAFVKDWRFYIEDDALLELETNTSQFSGIDDMYELGVELRSQYGNLYDESTVLPVFTSGFRRVVDSAVAFSAGFLQGLPGNSTRLNVIPEQYVMGKNSLTFETSCLNFIHYDSNSTYNRSIMGQEAARLNRESPGFNVTATDIYELAQYCAYELSAHGHSEVCNILSWDAFVEMEYVSDVSMWYEEAHTPYSFTMGAVLVNATATLFSEDPAAHNNQSLWFNFAHDIDLTYYANALGILDYQKDDLPLDRLEFGRYFKVTELVPMGAHIVVERLSDSQSGDKYVRVLVNEKVIPLPNCQDGPYFTCKLSSFTAQLEQKMNSTGSYDSVCGGNGTSVPSELSFFWDWQTAGYASTF